MKPMQETPIKKQSNAVKVAVAIAIGLVVTGLGVFIAKNPSLFKAELTQVGATPGNSVGNKLYIPDNYTATSPQANNTISIKVGDLGIGNECIRGMTADFSFDPAKIQFDASPLTIASTFGGNALAPDVSLTSPTVLHVVFTGANAVHFNSGATVFSLTLRVLSGLPADTTVPSISISVPSVAVSVKPYNGTACGTGNTTSSSLTSIATGKIKIIKPVCTSASQLWTFVDFSTISCVSGVKTRTVTDIASPTCDNTSNIARPATTQNCVCTTAAADWTCDAWAPAICPTSGAQTRTCTANNCIDSSSLKGAMESQNCNLVACTEAQVWTCTAWPATCETSGTKTRTCTAVVNPQCSNPATIAKPAETQDCVCTTAGSDWECTSWTPATCPQSGSQSRTCTAKNCKDTTARKAQMEAQTCTPPAVTNVTNCPATILATGAKARPNMLLKGPAGSMNWRLDGVVVSGDKIAEGGGSVKLSDLSVGTHSVTAEGGAPCTFTVGCYTSIETGNARRAVGSTDVAKLLLYDYDGNGAIDALDKKAIFEATKSCN